MLRTPPYAYNPEVPLDQKTTVDARKSLCSIHTAFAFASVVFMSITFQAYEPSSPLRPRVWAASLAAATSVSILRYSSGSHLPTDILVGAAVGTLAGITVPAVHAVGNGDHGLALAAGSSGVRIAF